MNRTDIETVLKDVKPRFNISTAQNGNFRLQLDKEEMKRGTEYQYRSFLELADKLRAANIDCDIKGAFKGNEGWVNYPTLWVNKTAKTVDSEVIAQAVAAGIAAYKATEKAKEAPPTPTEETANF